MAVSQLQQTSSDLERLEALAAMDILDTRAEVKFDRISKLISLIYDVDIAIV